MLERLEQIKLIAGVPSAALKSWPPSDLKPPHVKNRIVSNPMF
jgi:hypothetical protein